MFKIIAVTNRKLCSHSLLEQIERIARLDKPDRLILREKDLSEDKYEELAREVMKICGIYHIDCILHTYVQVAIRLKCEKIHMSVTGLANNKKLLQYFNEIGVSVHSVEEAIWAEENSASYITAGHIFATDCKKGIPPRGTIFLKEICETVSIPVYAIGGIDKDNILLVKEAGARGACIMSDYMKM